MKVCNHQGFPRVMIDPGESYVTKKNEIISTLLGSCVAACLYDPVNQVIGMNHFLLAQQHSTSNTPLLGTEQGRYGIHAMEILINGMLKQGAQRIHIKAKAFGGGDVLKLANEHRGEKSIGVSNVEFIQTFLAAERIPLVTSGLGGNIGRNIFFLAADFSVYVKTIDAVHQQALIKEERQFLNKKSLLEVAPTKNQADFW